MENSLLLEDDLVKLAQQVKKYILDRSDRYSVEDNMRDFIVYLFIGFTQANAHEFLMKVDSRLQDCSRIQSFYEANKESFGWTPDSADEGERSDSQ